MSELKCLSDGIVVVRISRVHVADSQRADLQ